MAVVAQEESGRLIDRMNGVTESWSLFSTLAGAVMAGWVIVTSLMLAVILDMVFQFESGARIALLLLWAVGAVAALVFMLVRPLRKQRTLDGTARRLEELFPDLDSDLINSVQLARIPHSPSPLLTEAAIRQANRRAASVRFERAAYELSWWQRFRDCMQTPRDLLMALGVCLVLAVFGGAFHYSFPAWPNAVYRLFHPTVFVPAVGAVEIREVAPGDAELLIGGKLTISARVDNPQHKEYSGTLIAIAADGSEQEYALVPSEDYDRYAFTFPKVTDPFRYRLEIGRTQTEHFAVTIFDRPRVRAMSAALRYPSYTGLTAETVELKGGVLEALQYTDVELQIATQAPVSEATVHVGEDEVPATCRLNEPLATARFPLVANGFYSIDLVDDRGYHNSDARQYPIRIIADEAPTLEVTRPGPEIVSAAGETVMIELRAGDDFGLSEVQLLSHVETADEIEEVVKTWDAFRDPCQTRLSYAWTMPELPDGSVLTYRVAARDNREVRLGDRKLDPQTTFSDVRRIRIVDRAAHQAEKLQTLEKFRQELWRIYKRQTDVRGATTPLTTTAQEQAGEKETRVSISIAQHEIADLTVALAESIGSEQQVLLPFKSTLANLAEGRMNEANGLARELATAESADAMNGSASRLANVQDDILDVLRKLLDMARAETSQTLAEMEKRPGGDLPDDVVGRLQDLHEKLEEFVEEQRKVIEASEDLAKKPVDDFTQEDEQKFQELAAVEDDWARFLKEQHSDLSRLPEQDFSNPSMLQELIEIETEIKMAADALTQKTAEIAVPLEQLGAEMAEEMTTNIEKWLPDTPDRERWSQEEPLTDAMREAPMAELPNELEDLVGDLMEEEEDLFDEMEDVSSSWADSLDKGAGWDAMDGPISNMSARGVTGNRLPNTSEIGGRSGEGRQGKSSGEFVGDSAVGKGGRKTPSRLTPDAFEQGQVKDTSTDPVGGATGGGKESGQGGEGLEGPIPPPLKRELGRLAGKQASLRNRAETIRLQFQIVNYNIDDLDALIEQMKTVERQLRSGHFRSALRRRDVMLGSLDDLRTQTTEQSEIQTDTTSSVPQALRKKILGSMQDASPEGWEELNKSYFERIATGQ